MNASATELAARAARSGCPLSKAIFTRRELRIGSIVNLERKALVSGEVTTRSSAASGAGGGGIGIQRTSHSRTVASVRSGSALGLSTNSGCWSSWSKPMTRFASERDWRIRYWV